MIKWNVILALTIIPFCTLGILLSQEVSTFEYFFNDGNLRSAVIQQKDDGNFIITTQKDCYTPNSTTIEGCPIARHVFEIDDEGSVIWSSDLELSHNFVFEKMYNDENGNWLFATSQPINYTCEQIGVALWGFFRISQFRLSPEYSIIDTTILNMECGYHVIDFVRNQNFQAHMLTIADSATLFYNTHYISLDSSMNVLVDQILPSSNLEYKSLLLTENDKLFATRVDHTNDSLYMVHIGPEGNISNSFPIYTNKHFRDIQMKRLMNSDILIGVLMKSYSAQDQVYKLIRITQEGEIKWSKSYEGILNGIILEQQDESILFVTSKFNNETNSEDVYLEVLNFNGDFLSSKFYDVNEKADVPIDAIFDESNHLVILGNSNCCNEDITIGPGSAFVIIDSSNLVVTSSKSLQKNEFLFYPNPTTGQINFASETAFQVEEIHLVDMQGRTVFETQLSLEGQIDISAIKAGVYVLKIINSDGLAHVSKILKF